jgi:SAM-dependent methyltransferase
MLFTPPKLMPLLYPLGNIAAPCSSDILLRREIVERVRGFEERFEGMYQSYEDQAFLAKLYLHGAVLPVNECWDRHRIPPDSRGSVVAKADQYHTVRSFFLHCLETYLYEQGTRDEMLWKALRHALWPYRHPMLHRLSNHARPFVERVKGALEVGTGKTLGAATRWQLRHFDPGHSITVGKVNFGNLRRLEPLSRDWGLDRGLPIDRYYIEGFLARNSTDIKGRVLEIGDDTYTRRFGGAQVTKSDVLHVEEGNPLATIIADLTCADHVPRESFDCIILIQTLHLIYDVRAALQTLQRILKPEGVLLATFPGITQISRREWRGSWYWSFTSFSAQRLFNEVFGEKALVQSYGNVLAASAFLYGIATEDLCREELECRDPDYEVTITVRAVKGG